MSAQKPDKGNPPKNAQSSAANKDAEISSPKDSGTVDDCTPSADYARDCQPRNIGSALQDVYQKTVEEEVPDELMSLLDRLS